MAIYASINKHLHTLTDSSLVRGRVYATVVAVPTAMRNERSRCLYVCGTIRTRECMSGYRRAAPCLGSFVTATVGKVDDSVKRLV
jgi:hypothetical protein